MTQVLDSIRGRSYLQVRPAQSSLERLTDVQAPDPTLFIVRGKSARCAASRRRGRRSRSDDVVACCSQFRRGVRAAGYEIPGKFELDREFDGKTKTRPSGILYITTGGGGNASLHSPEQTDNPDTWQPFTVKYNASVNQFTDLRMDGNLLALRQIDLNGKLIDEIRISK